VSHIYWLLCSDHNSQLTNPSRPKIKVVEYALKKKVTMKNMIVVLIIIAALTARTVSLLLFYVLSGLASLSLSLD